MAKPIKNRAQEKSILVKHIPKQESVTPQVAEEEDDLFDFEFVGGRISHVRRFVGESREHMSMVLKISQVQYGKLENESSASFKVLTACLNYFLIKYKINPAWIMSKYNEMFEMQVSPNKDLHTMISELNKKIKDQNLQVTLVSIS